MKPEVDPHNKIMGSLQCKTCSLRLLLVMAILGLSLLLNVLQAVPASRMRDLADQKSYMVVGNTKDQMIEEDIWEEGTDEHFIHGRMDLQSTDYSRGGPHNRHDPDGDYPGTGANNSHDPGGGGGSRPGKNAPP